jgi:adenylate cyclase
MRLPGSFADGQTSGMRLGLKNVIAVLAIAAAATITAELISRTVAFHDLQLWAYDFVVTHSPETRRTPNVVIVDFDDATLARERQFPIPRDVVATVISRVAEAGAKVIGLDFLLTEARSEPQDAAMEQALAQAGNVVLASQAGSGGIPPLLPLRRFCVPDPATFGDCTQAAFGFAIVNLPIDNDGFIRRFMLFSLDEHRSEAFPLRLAELFTGTPLTAGRRLATFRGHSVPYASGDATVLIGSWARNPAPSISALAVLDGKTSASDFRGKVVLFGQSNDAARDREFTPMFRLSGSDGARLRLSGTQIHAAAVATLLDGTAIRPLSKLVVLPLTFVLTCLSVLMWLRSNLRFSALGALVLLASVYLASQFLFAFGHMWLPYLTAQASIVLAIPLSLGYQFVNERLHRSEAVAERLQLMNLFSRYMAPEVANEIWRQRDSVVLAGEERVATVLFSDIRSFTEMTAGKPSQVVLAWLNEYFTAMEEVITSERGFLNKFIGDGLMVLFGVPLSQGPEEDAVHAVRTALRMLQKLQELNAARPLNSELPAFRIGIGIHTGKLTAGSIGSRNRLEYSAIGDSVNLASRCESLNKEFKTEIILTEATYKLVADRFSGFRDLGVARVRGFHEGIQLYTVEPDPHMADALGTESEALRAADAGREHNPVESR